MHVFEISQKLEEIIVHAEQKLEGEFPILIVIAADESKKRIYTCGTVNGQVELEVLQKLCVSIQSGNAEDIPPNVTKDTPKLSLSELGKTNN